MKNQSQRLVLQFDVDVPFIEDIAQEIVEEHEIDGVGERCHFRGGYHRMYAVEHGSAHTDMSQNDVQHLTHHVDEERVDTEYPEEGAPLLFPPHIDDNHERTLQQRSQSTGHQYVTRTPYPLVEWQAI